MSKILVISIALLFAIVFGTFVLLPKYQSFQIIRGRVEEKEQELSFKEEHLSDLHRIKEELSAYEEELSLINSALPPDPNSPPLINFMERNASDSGLILKEISDFSTMPVFETGVGRSNQRVDTGLRMSALTFEVVGPFNSFLDFLSGLEKSARLIEVVSVKFSSPIDETIDVFPFEVKINVYSY